MAFFIQAKVSNVLNLDFQFFVYTFLVNHEKNLLCLFHEIIKNWSLINPLRSESMHVVIEKKAVKNILKECLKKI